MWEWKNDSPFGDNLPNEDPSAIGTAFKFNLRFPGQYADVETGTNYNYYRDYDPATGRYVQSDPIGLWGGLSTYSYVSSRPLMATDSKGLSDDGSGGKVIPFPGKKPKPDDGGTCPNDDPCVDLLAALKVRMVQLLVRASKGIDVIFEIRQYEAARAEFCKVCPSMCSKAPQVPYQLRP